MTLTTVQQDILEFRRQLYRPPPEQTVIGWAESNIILTRRQTEYPGPFSTSVRPYMRECIECWKDPAVSEVVLCWGSQTAKTTALMIGAVWSICEDPGPLLWIMPSEHLARSFSKSRWRPMLDDSPAAREELPASRSDMTNLEQHFRQCTLTFVGSNSPSNLASRPVRVVVADEVDKFATATDSEADALSLAEQRLKAFSSSKLFLTSTPTVFDGRIWQRYLQGDQRRFLIPCPHCQNPIKLLWKHVKWDAGAQHPDATWDLDRVQASAHYECQECGGHMTDAQKIRALRHGEWKAEAQGSPGVRSYHLSSLYSPDRKCTWGALAIQFLREKMSLIGLQGFINGALAEPWEDQYERVARTESIIREVSTPIGDAPLKLLSADHQALAPHFWYVVREFARNGASRLLAAGACLTWEDLRAIQLAHGIEDRAVVVDSGYDALTVYKACLAYGRLVQRQGSLPVFAGWIPGKGRPKESGWLDPEKRSPRVWTIQSAVVEHLRFAIPVLHFNSPALRDVLASLRQANTGIPWQVLESVATDTYWTHMDSHMRRPVVHGKRAVVEWVKRSQRTPDHLLDAEIQILALAMLHGRFHWAVRIEDPKSNFMSRIETVASPERVPNLPP